MTTHEAYIEGFCKQASSLGVNMPLMYASHRNLVKKAGFGTWLGGRIGRWFELLGGGRGRGAYQRVINRANKRITEAQGLMDTAKLNWSKFYEPYNKKLEELTAEKFKAWEAWSRSGFRDPTALSRYNEVNNKLLELNTPAREFLNQTQAEVGRLSDIINKHKQTISRAEKKIGPESWKVSATRWGTGLTAAGGLGLLLNNQKEKQDFGTEDNYLGY